MLCNTRDNYNQHKLASVCVCVCVALKSIELCVDGYVGLNIFLFSDIQFLVDFSRSPFLGALSLYNANLFNICRPFIFIMPFLSFHSNGSQHQHTIISMNRRKTTAFTVKERFLSSSPQPENATIFRVVITMNLNCWHRTDEMKSTCTTSNQRTQKKTHQVYRF